MSAPTTLVAVLTLTMSTHPEYLFFGTLRVNGSQMSSHFNTREEMATWVAGAHRATATRGITLHMEDETR